MLGSMSSVYELGSVPTSFAQLTWQVAVMNKMVFALGALLAVLPSGALA